MVWFLLIYGEIEEDERKERKKEGKGENERRGDMISEGMDEEGKRSGRRGRETKGIKSDKEGE